MKPTCTKKLFLLIVFFLLLGSSQQTTAQLSGKTIGIDPGHGGTDPGAVGWDGDGYPNEKDFNLLVALKYRTKLQNAGATVEMTRTTDVTVGLFTRRDYMRNLNPHHYVSVHCNSFTDPSANGTETYWHTNGNTQDQQIATKVQNRLIQYLGRANRGVKQALFTVLDAPAPGALAELLFISNQTEFNIINTDAGQENAATGLYYGSSDFAGVSSPPIAPSNLVALANGTTVNLTWTDNSTNEDGFRIERKTGASGTYSEIATVGANVASYSNTGVSTNQVYYYRVRAYNSAGNSGYSNEYYATTMTAPSGLGASAVSSTQINSNWSENASGETGYKIERKTGVSGTWSEIADVSANSTSYSNMGLSANTTYYYRVRAYANSTTPTPHYSSYSNEANATTPSVPTVTVTSPNSGEVWTIGSVRNITATITGSITGKQIDYSTDGGSSWIFVWGISTTDPSLNYSWTVPNTPSTTCRVKVTALYSSGSVSDMSDGNFTILAPPSPPSNLVALANGTTINLTWTDNSTNESGFYIERKTGASGTYSQIAAVGANVTTYTDAAPSTNQNFYYRVRAYNAAGTSGYSNEYYAIVMAAPTSLSATAISSTQINISWTDNSDRENGYRIERKTGVGGSWSEIADVPANSSSYSNTGLSPNTTYYYRVRAYANSTTPTPHYSSYSNEANATTTPPAPTAQAPTNGSTVTTLRPTLQVASISGATQYNFRVYRSGTPVRDVNTTSNSWTLDVDLQNGAQHDWDCRAQNAAGWGSYLSPQWTFTVSILPPAPTAQAPANGSTVITLRPTLQVASISGATQYNFRVYRSGTPVRDVNTTSNSWTVDVDLQNGAQHDWDCRARNATGWGSYLSPQWTFTVSILPPAPTAQAPANGSTVTTLRPTLQVASISGATQYNFRVYRSGTPVRDVNTTSNSWTLDVDLQNGAQHDWDCRAQNAAGWGSYLSPQWTFTVSILPPAPTAQAPANGSTVTTLRPTLQVASISGATQYNFRVYRSGTPVRDVNTTSNSWTVDVDLQNGAQHEWDCRAQNAAGWGSYFSPHWTFTVSVLPPAPMAQAPANGSTVTTLRPTLQVASLSGVTKYQFRGYRSGTLVREDSVTSNSWTVDLDLQNGAEHEWDCRVQNAAGWGAYFSPRWTFIVSVLPAQVALVSPTNFSTLSSDTVTFIWHPSQPQISLYWLERSTDSTFSNSAVDSSIVDTSTIVPGLANNQTHWWKVKAKNSDGWGSFSDTWRFYLSIVSVDEAEQLPKQFALSQNFPNPFNPSTTIKFAVPRKSHVRLSVFDVLGREIATLVDEEKPPGNHEVQFNAGGYASGVYFYRLQTPGYVETKKLVLVR